MLRYMYTACLVHFKIEDMGWDLERFKRWTNMLTTKTTRAGQEYASC
jgi:hypothetical protein